MTRFKRSELISKIFYQKNQKRQKKMKDIHILLKINIMSISFLMIKNRFQRRQLYKTTDQLISKKEQESLIERSPSKSSLLVLPTLFWVWGCPIRINLSLFYIVCQYKTNILLSILTVIAKTRTIVEMMTQTIKLQLHLTFTKTTHRSLLTLKGLKIR